ncbi:3-hydroxyacyl-CoA dehydrogenase [Ehrlichia japonica]|uniref:3-hydroxyacyl-CoA dehydrogenase, C-terminal domain protein n=1 Tax=Ehrlichia japonica TaxID=391036 RepID=X5H0Z1_9RICK|nr:3-hydroxyacyl-CoA dehydrogenase [Ehrlichia japonica]AHX04459.1 3-hydroxyacyl-CoA dehydrogenase, C-terminal domain protein [Ehrlichia japonica]
MQKVAVVNFKKIDNSALITYMAKCNISVILINLDSNGNNFQNQVKNVSLNDNLSCLKDVKWVINIDSEKSEENYNLIYNVYNKILPYLSNNIIISATSNFFLDVVSKIPCNISCKFTVVSFFYYTNKIKLIECAYHNSLKDKGIEVLSSRFPNLIICNNIPGLILDRIFSFWLIISLIGAYKFSINVEEADFIISNQYMGIPHGAFNLLDEIGLDNFISRIKYLVKHLPNDDYLCKLYDAIPTVILQMISDGYIGSMSKIGGGFYRLYESHYGNSNQVIDLHTGLYRKPCIINYEFRSIQNLFDVQNKYGQFMCYIWSNTLIYVSSLIPKLSSNISVIDKAIKLAYNWKYGPFEIIDLLNHSIDNKLFDSVEYNNLPQILSIRKRMYNDKRQCLSIDGTYL